MPLGTGNYQRTPNAPKTLAKILAKIHMLSAAKPAVLVKGEDEAAQCTMVTASGPTKLEKAAGLASYRPQEDAPVPQVIKVPVPGAARDGDE